MHDGEKQTQINEFGPEISSDELSNLQRKIKKELKQLSIDIVVMSGTIPLGVPNDIYYQLIAFIKSISPETKIILDTSQTVLKDTLKLCFENNIFPYAIKPNIDELKEIADSESDDVMKLISVSHMETIPMVIVSKGAEGCFAKMGSEIYTAKVPRIEAINPTGSGDSTVGALAFAFEHGLSNENILRSAMAAGESNALEEKIGYLTDVNYEKYYKQIDVKKIN